MSTGRDRIGSEARAFAGFLAGLPGLLRHRMSYEEARGIVLQRLRDREANFLSSMEHGVFGNPRSPYRALLELAGCEYGDLVRSVHHLGLEDTLRNLREAGVYVSFEEFKGRVPLVRGGRTIPVREGDFDNPRFRNYLAMSTSGSSGTPRRVLMDLTSMSARLPVKVLSVHYHGLVGTRWIRWGDIPPGIGLTASLTDWVCGTPPDRWFTAVWGGRDGTSSRFRAATIASLAVARLSGAKLPWPEYLPLDGAATIARLAGEILRRDGRCQVRAGVSRLLRVALAAREEGIDLTGAVMHGGGEPPSSAKVAGITGSGARFLSSYHFTEAGAIGHGCTATDDPNDQHFQKDHLAMIQTRRMVPGFDVEVGVLSFTSLLPTATKLLLNVESDDYAVVETRSCGCPWGELGLTDHISDIRSFGKLTGEGVTLVGSDVERILEEVLPARFGGSPLDYQLVEEEDHQGFTRLILRVSPSITLADEAAPAELVYQALRAEGAGGATSASKWKQAGTLSVRREAPRPTARGKLLPLQLLKATRRAVTLALSLAISACAQVSGDGADRPDPVIRVAMQPYLSYAPVLFASEEGYFKDEGLDVRLVVLGRSEQTLVAMLSGEADVWPGTITPGFLRAVALGGGIKIVGDKGYLSADGCTYVGIALRKGMDPATAARSLRTFNHNREGANSYLADRMLASRGVDLNRLKLVTIPAEAMPGALADSVLDASASAEPFLSRAARAGWLWIRAQDVAPDYQWGVLTFGARLLNERRDLGERFLAAYRRGAAQANLGKTPHNLDVLSRATGMTLDELRDTCWPTYRENGRIRLEDILDYQRWARAHELLDTVATPAQLYDSSFAVASDRLMKPGRN